MDFLYISPEFPCNYAQFVRSLDKMGARVWGVGEADFYSMPESLRAAMKWYVRADLNSFSAVKQALGRLIRAKIQLGTPPRFDLAESHNEHWLRLEARINEAFGIGGILPADLERLKKKSAMKRVFRASGLAVARGDRVRDLSHGLVLASEVGYPLILKPEEGVGAGGIHKVADESELRRLLGELDGEYVLEEYIDRPIVTYDGLVDRQGRLLFENSLVYGEGVLEYVMGKEPFFYVSRDIPAPLARIGQRIVQAFDIRRKFFHFEFFKTEDGYIPIEINCRPPGGPIMDMMNYSIDGDLYEAYARMIVQGEASVSSEKKYYCGYVGRRERGSGMTHGQIMDRFGRCLVEHGENPPVFQAAMGQYRYIVRCQSEEELLDIAKAILAT